jgi:arylsulfate sulfotransferase
MNYQVLRSLLTTGVATGLAVLLTMAPATAAATRHAHLRASVHRPRPNFDIPFSGAEGTIVPLGASITWSADVDGSDAGVLWYRYRVTGPDGAQHLIRDFGPDPELSWTTIETEGAYEMELTVRYLDSGEFDVSTATFQFQPLVTGDGPVVTPTIHPLVVIYSAPACAAGATMKVQYVGPSGTVEETPERACGDNTMNFYVGGLRQQSDYQIRHVITDSQGMRTKGPATTVTSGTPTYQFADFNVATPPVTGAGRPVILYSALFEPVVATDLDGNVIWYYLSQLSSLTRPDGGGRFWGFGENPALGPDSQVLRLFDLAGNTLLETNAARINEQLVSRGKQAITGFHHEVRPQQDGTILVLAGAERILTDVQGPGDVDVLGDVILVLNRDMEVLWSWNSFEHLDTRRMAILGETCGAGAGGCAPFYLAPTANDWLHGNALQLMADGNILYSMRHQDWLAKIDYENGAGNGQILWRMGVGGDFSINSSDPNPWFSHQHDPNFDLSDPTLLYAFDNGNTRVASDPSAHSRGQAYRVDEQARTVSPMLSADLGNFSLALGSAARLPNGNFHFDLGWIQQDYGPMSRSVEVDPSGKIVYEIQAPTAFYRTFRLSSLYAPESQ